MVRFVALSSLLVACGSSSAPAPKPAVAPVASSDEADREAAERERARREALAKAHHAKEDEQQEALAAKCETPGASNKAERCLPSCYQTETADPRAGKTIAGFVEIGHFVCEAEGREGPFFVDELAAATLPLRGVRGRPPKPHKQGSWQADVERALAEQHPTSRGGKAAKLPRGDSYVVTGTKWRTLEHPATKERLRCTTVSHFTRSLRGKADECGSTGAIACEAKGNPTARAINVVHYRLAEARQLHDAGRDQDCQQAALEAIAVARGLPRWRQYVQLNVNQWKAFAAYRTRYDGVLDEEALFARTAQMGTEAEALYATCGGGRPTTTAAQEQSFHTCW